MTSKESGVTIRHGIEHKVEYSYVHRVLMVVQGEVVTAFFLGCLYTYNERRQYLKAIGQVVTVSYIRASTSTRSMNVTLRI